MLFENLFIAQKFNFAESGLVLMEENSFVKAFQIHLILPDVEVDSLR